MSNHGRRRMTRREAEQLLTDPGSSRHALAPFLLAARTSQARSDAAREDAAASAFVVARSAAPVAVRRTRRPVTKALAGSGLAVVLATGGVSLAATGHLPMLPDRASDRATESLDSAGSPGSPGSSAGAPSVADPSTGSATPKQKDGSAKPSATTDPSDGASPTPNLPGLCRAFQAQETSAPGAKLESAAFTVLVAAAGGKDAVAAYCVSLVGEPKDTGAPEGAGKPSRTPKPDKPSQPARPDKPAQAPKPDKPTQTPDPDGAAQSDGVGNGAGADKRKTAGKRKVSSR